MMAVIADFGFGSLGISKEDFLIHENMIQLGYPPLRIDILNHIDGVVFSDAYINKKSINIEGLDVHFIGFQELILNKKASGRNADLDDLENLT